MLDDRLKNLDPKLKSKFYKKFTEIFESYLKDGDKLNKEAIDLLTEISIKEAKISLHLEDDMI